MANPADNLPSRSDLFTLPRWALVAFAVRCAQRVFPLLEQAIADKTHAEKAAELIRAAISGSQKGDFIDPRIFNVTLTAPDPTDIEVSIFVVTRLSLVVRAAIAAAQAAADDEVSSYMTYSAAAASDASYAAWSAVQAARTDKEIVAQAIHQDFEILRTRFAEDRCKPEDGVDITLLGPLWLKGTPEWFYESDLLNPERADAAAFDSLPTLELFFEPGNASKKSLQRVLEALSKLHIAAGGAGLKFQPGDGFIYVREHVAA